MSVRQIAINTAILLISFVLFIGLFEAGYRVVTYVQARGDYAPFAFWWWNSDVYAFDEATGYTYQPATNARLTQTGADDVGLFANNVTINKQGRVSTRDDVPDADTYRIALIGDSFTAGVFSPTPWGDLLEDTLNADREWLATVGAQQVDVANFGREAIGFEQFAAIYTHEVSAYQPDRVIVSFISEDVQRRFLWRGTVTVDEYPVHLTCYRLPVALDNPYCRYGTLVLDEAFVSDGDELATLRKTLYFSDLSRRPWFGIYPELLAHFVGAQIGLPPRLTDDETVMRLYTNDTVAIERAQSALATIQAGEHITHVIHIPTHIELWDNQLEPIGARFLTEQTGIRLASDYFPQTQDQGTIASWYNLPHDGHFSAIGADLYAGVVADIVRESQ